MTMKKSIWSSRQKPVRDQDLSAMADGMMIDGEKNQAGQGEKGG